MCYEFVLPMTTVAPAIFSSLQFVADLTAVPWLNMDFVNNRS